MAVELPVSGLFCVYGIFSDGGGAGDGEGCRVGADPGFDAFCTVRVIKEMLFDAFTALDSGIFHGKPGACLVNDAEVHCQVDYLSDAGDALAVDHVKLRFPERGSDFVFHDFDSGAGADLGAAVLDGVGPADFKTDACIVLQRKAAGGGFGIAVRVADLQAELVDKDDRTAVFGDGAGKAPHGL